MDEAKNLIQLIVENNPGDVKLRIKAYLRNGADKWTNQQVIDYIYKLYKQGYNVSMFLSPVKVLKTSPNFIQVKEFLKTYSENLNSPEARNFEETGGENNVTGQKSFFDSQFGQIILGLGGGILGGSILGGLLFPDLTDDNKPNPPTNPNMTNDTRTFKQKVKDFFINHPYIAWGGTAVATVLLIWILRKIFSKKKAAIIPGVTPAV